MEHRPSIASAAANDRGPSTSFTPSSSVTLAVRPQRTEKSASGRSSGRLATAPRALASFRGQYLVSALAFALGAVACAPRVPLPQLADRDAVDLPEAKFHLEFSDVDRDAEAQVKTALESAAPRITRWGAFAEAVTVNIYPDHDGLEAAVNRFDYPWLRAWARYRQIFLQSPRSWGLLGGTLPQLTELLTHELTHCLMYQLSANDQTWADKGIPLWFREGMASVTANQGYRRPSPEDLFRFMQTHQGENPVTDAETLYQKDSEIVYGAAHRAFQFLVDRYGEAKVKDVLAAMKSGLAFGPAFGRVIGLSSAEFERDFVNYVRWGGWRRDGAPRAHAEPPVLSGALLALLRAPSAAAPDRPPPPAPAWAAPPR